MRKPSRYLAASLLALALPVSFGQSSGTQAAEEDLQEVVVTATRKNQYLAGVTAQEAAKSRVTVTAEYLETQATGQTVFQSLNLVPGVNFTNTDPYGSAGGNLRIRGFDGARVSVTFDGMPLNDSGNYALFTQQMLDPELVEQVDVNLGTTDADSPTASATGGTVAYRSVKPRDEMGGRVTLAGGENAYRRAFLMFDTGEFGPWGTKAWIAGSTTQYDKFKGPGELKKKQVNFKVYQGFDNGNFVSIAGHFNRNRNAFYRTTSFANYTLYGLGYENLATCARDLPTAGVADNENATPVANSATLLAADNVLNPSSCTNFYGVRINPSDTGNIRLQSLFHFGDRLRLAIDPSMQYALANGGGTTSLTERPAATAADRRILGTSALTTFDLNGDGDTLDTGVRFYTPNTTNTYRLGVNASLIWDITETQRVRLAYTLDRARHRQTGEWGYMADDGTPESVFAGNDGRRVATADGSFLRGRDRYSIAELNQVAAEYRGKFLDNRLTATVGVRSPKFKRELNQYCYSQNGAFSFLCTTQTPAVTLANGNVLFVNGAVTATNPEYIRPYSDTVKFDEVLPNVGLTWQPVDNHMLYISYAKGLSAPRTDNLYIVRRVANNAIGRGLPDSETTNSFDLGWRYNTPSVLASIALWKSDYKNRIVSAFDPEVGFNVDRNVGAVALRGVDMQLGWRVNEITTVSMSTSYNKSTLQDNLQLITDAQLAAGGALVPTKGKSLVETPKWTYTIRGDFNIVQGLRVGMQGKRVGSRFGTDLNDEVSPGYTVWDLDARYQFETTKLRNLQIKLNVTNLFDEQYFGNISSGIGTLQSNAALAGFQGFSGVGFYSIGSPRTIQLSLEAAL